MQLAAQQKTTDSARLEFEENAARLAVLEIDFSEKKQAADFSKNALAETAAWLHVDSKIAKENIRRFDSLR